MANQVEPALSPAVPGTPTAAPPSQFSIGSRSERHSAAESSDRHLREAQAALQEAQLQNSLVPELTSGPHLRSVVLLFVVALFVVTAVWIQQAMIVPLVLLCTTTTSALWCMPGELVISMGPIPVCFLRRRIPYGEIRSVTEVRGRLRTAGAVVRRMMQPWRPLGFGYGLTLGKDLIDIELVPSAKKTQGYFMSQPVLISVDQAEDIISHVLFKQKYGSGAPLPESLLARAPLRWTAHKVKWVVLDAFDLLLSMHSQNRTACDVCGLICAPFQGFIEAQRTKAWLNERDHDL